MLDEKGKKITWLSAKFVGPDYNSVLLFCLIAQDKVRAACFFL